MPAYAKKLMPALQAATRHNIPSHEFAAAYDALNRNGYFDANAKPLTATDLIIIILDAAEKARESGKDKN